MGQLVKGPGPQETKPGVLAVLVRVKGIVQGVGFRPYVYGLAEKWGLTGWVLNDNQGVQIWLEGDRGSLHAFLEELRTSPPRLAHIVDLEVGAKRPEGFAGFSILQSSGQQRREVLISPDVAICDDCRRELFDPQDRRYRYPFTNCTNCGPRFTIIKDLPYDRERTSMAAFPLCPDCSREYHDPADRRFHAQPNACPTCGPHVKLVDASLREVSGDWDREFRRLILLGKIIAVKGLGGFHLACDAKNQAALAELRRRKGRPAKPLAVMARDLEVIRGYCLISAQEEALLMSPAAPIVLLPLKEDGVLDGEGFAGPGPQGGPDSGRRTAADGVGVLPEELAPGLRHLGVMLPYTPLHLLLFGDGVDLLVMTSGNQKDLPLEKDNEGACQRLAGIADYFLLHNRDIVDRCDDSVLRVVSVEAPGGNSAPAIQFIRRSRGYAPGPLDLREVTGAGPAVLGAGGEMKNTFCLLKDGRATLSQHLGEMENVQGLDNYRQALGRLQYLLDADPEVVACDLHPSYRISRLAREMRGLRQVEVQHHHAHLASVMAENNLKGPVIGLIGDGTGYGTDGNLWGFEVLLGDYRDFRRLIHLDYIRLPGGEGSIRYPYRVATSFLWQYLGERGWEAARQLFLKGGSTGTPSQPGREKELELVARLAKSGLNSPWCSSAGRLFDAVAAILGICSENTYEGQAPALLGERAKEGVEGTYGFTLKEGILYPGEIFAGLLEDLARGEEKGVMAAKFHNTVVAMLVAGALKAREESGEPRVALSGGLFQNPYLFRRLVRLLRREGFLVHYHRQVPPNDGGLALGQAVVGFWRVREG